MERNAYIRKLNNLSLNNTFPFNYMAFQPLQYFSELKIFFVK